MTRGLELAGPPVQALRRAAVGQGLHVAVHGVPRGLGQVLVVANHTSRVDRRVLSSVWPTPLLGADAGLRWGGSSLAFPEGGISPDGSLGRFLPEPFETLQRLWRRGRRIALVPVAISGTFGLDTQLPWWRAATEQPRIVVRAAPAVTQWDGSAAELAAFARTQVAELLAEGESTWWHQRRDPQPIPAPAQPRWHEAWRHSQRREAPGVAPARRIWK